MTRKIRIGKDIVTRLRVKTNGSAVPLEGRDISVDIISTRGFRLPVTDFSVIDTNLLTFVFYGKSQPRPDNYIVVVWENKGKKGQTVVDTFNEYVDLVPFTKFESGAHGDEGLDTELVELEVDLDGSNKGYSTYECWLLDGHEGYGERSRGRRMTGMRDDEGYGERDYGERWDYGDRRGVRGTGPYSMYR